MDKLLKTVVAVVLFPLLLPVVLLALATYALHGAALYVMVWTVWCLRGKHVLLVYSESPVWRDYLESNIVPRLPRSTVVLNWSQRRTWRWYRLGVMVMRYFGGSRQFNPMVVTFQPFRPARVFRFWRAFKDYQHGNRRTLAAVERDLWAYVANSGISAADRASQSDRTPSV